MTVVRTQGGDLAGQELPTGGTVFAGIPFAAPPVGDLRLRAPQPPQPWAGTRTSAFPPAPPQRQQVDHDEDCLYLNIWTPGPPGPHPVLVWLYGGGFENGSASPPGTDGSRLAQQLGAVVVAPNYRLGALGFLHLAGPGGPRSASSGNLGLQDQVAALEWVRDNIAGFGGTPENVTLAGISAGAFCIGALLAVPRARGLFQRAILHSGSTGRIFPAATATALAHDFLHALEVNDLDELARIGTPQILDAQDAVVDHDIGDRNLPGGHAWGVVLDGNVLTCDPPAAVVAGDAASVALLVCATRDEVQLYEKLQPDFAPGDELALTAEMERAGHASGAALLRAYRTRHPDEDLTRLRTRFLTDAIYRLPAARLAADQIAAGGRAWSSLQAATPYGVDLGACHGTELALLFDGTTAQPPLPTDSHGLIRARDQLVAAWRSFVHTGDPGWPEYAPGKPTTRAYGGSEDLVVEPPADAVTALWSDVSSACVARAAVTARGSAAEPGRATGAPPH